MGSRDHIRITDLFFRGKHGVGNAERNIEQEFLIEADLSFDTQKAGVSDKLVDTLDYSKVRNKIREVIEGPSRYLIEALAEDIAKRILEDKRIKSVEITIRKTAVWKNGVPSVTITRNN
jgi:dihydroneopterin aldolase